MERVPPEIARLAEDFIQESHSIQNRQELLSKIAEYERRICDITKGSAPIITQQPTQNFYEPKIPSPSVLSNPFAPTEDQRKQYKTTNNFKNMDSNVGLNASRSGNEFFRPVQQDLERMGMGDTGYRIPRAPLGLADTMVQMVRPRDQFPFQHNEFLKDHSEEEPEYVKFYKKQVQVSPFHSRRV